MPKPLIVVMSQRPRWTSELPLSGGSRFRFLTCDTLDEVTRLPVEHRPAGLIADLTGVRGGGHQQERTLEQIRESMSDLPLAMLTDTDCPEPLERRAIYSGILHLKGDVTVRAVMDWLEESVESTPENSGRPQFDAAVLPATRSSSTVATLEHGTPPASSQRRTGSGFHQVAASTATTTMNDTSVSEKPADQVTVLAGITRRFETFTPELKTMLGDLEIAAEKDVTVLLIGETGSGKTFLSNLIHEVSPRRAEPFITVACGALPGDLLESELFGHSKGSFTSAHADKEGKFIAAKRGTILLDEVDVLGLEQQVKLLRVIETGQFEPVGSNTTLVSQARLVVASNLPLEPLVEKGKFRPDLYYRLSMLKFEILPLRKRQADVKALARRFIQSKCEKHSVSVARVEQEFFDALMNYPWPGNVRELEYAIQRAVIYCRDGVLRASHLPGHIVAGVAGPTNDPTVKLDTHRSAENEKELGSQLAHTEKDLIMQALMRNNYNRTKTAKELGVSRVTLYNKMKRYDIN